MRAEDPHVSGAYLELFDLVFPVIDCDILFFVQLHPNRNTHTHTHTHTERERQYNCKLRFQGLHKRMPPMHKQAKRRIMTPPVAAAHSSFAGPFVLPVRHMSTITLTWAASRSLTRYHMQIQAQYAQDHTSLICMWHNLQLRDSLFLFNDGVVGGRGIFIA